MQKTKCNQPAYDECFFAPKSRSQWRNVHHVQQLGFAVLVCFTFGIQGGAE